MARYIVKYALTCIVFLVLVGATAQASVDVPDGAFATGADDSGDPRVETRLVVDVAEATPGSTIRVGVLYTIDPDWHIYWHNSGNSGLPTRIDWTGTGIPVGPLQWPAPEVYSEAGGFLTTYGYSNEVLLFAEATVPEDATDTFEVIATTSYLACAQQCIRGRGELRLQVPVSTAATPAAPEVVSYFDLATGCVPKTPEELDLQVRVSYSRSVLPPNDEIGIAVEAITVDEPPTESGRFRHFTLGERPEAAFLPELSGDLSFEVTDIGAHPTAYAGNVVRLTAYSGPEVVDGEQRFAGVLRLLDSGGACIPVAIETQLPRAPSGATVEGVDNPIFEAVLAAYDDSTEGSADAVETTSEPADASGSSGPKGGISLWLALFYAFLGGLILNVMPCVFPVLALKVHALIELGQQEIYGRDEEKSGTIPALIAYTFGVWTPLWILAGVIVALKASGETVGWGIQFQHPELIALVAALVVAFAANLFGVFEISMGAARLGRAADAATGLKRSFLEGILLVLLATPCSAPMLGPAVGFGLLADNVVHTFLIFTSVGVGLVFPFAVLVLIPGWVRVLPKPGNWMHRFKQLVGFSFLGAVIWLGWIVGQTTGVSGMTRFMVFMLAVAITAWVFGILQAAQTRLRWGLVVAASMLTLSGIALLDLELVRAGAKQEGPITWVSYDETAVAAELEAGRPVFVDFTADWCATCKTNERLILASDRVVAAMEEHNVATFVADWTLPDERIEAALARFGRASVPMYLVYSPSEPDDPVILPEILTVSRVVNTLDAAAGSE